MVILTIPWPIFSQKKVIALAISSNTITFYLFADYSSAFIGLILIPGPIVDETEMLRRY